jgi:RNA polymerase primary sigma factor
MSRAIADYARIIRVPVHMHERINQVRRMTWYLADKLGRPPTTEEVAEHLETDAKQVLKAMTAERRTISLHTPLSDDEEATLMDRIPDTRSPDAQKETIEKDRKIGTYKLMEILTPKEREILIMRSGLDEGSEMTLEEVGEVFNVTRERIRQIEAKALRKLRTNPRRQAMARELLTGEMTKDWRRR